MAGFRDFIKSNAKFAYGGLVGIPFLGTDLKDIVGSDSKLKALLRTISAFVLAKVAFVGVFTAAGAAVKSLVRESGSLDAALRKLASIQSFQRIFAPLLGGAAAARQRVAELGTLSGRGPFKFEEVATASQRLQTSTRGAFSDPGAIKTVGAAAIGTGNNITEAADAVGNFYSTLREGRPVEGAVEQLRQMGLISQSTADHLSKMAESGMGVAPVFAELTRSLDQTGRSADQYKDDLASVTAEHDKAAAALKQTFAAPWTESETQNMKNGTAAMAAITPVVGRIAEFLANLYNGFSTAGSALLKFVAENKTVQTVLELTVKILGLATAAALIFGLSAVPALIRAVGAATTAFTAWVAATTGMTVAATALGVALRVLAIGTIFGLVATALVTGIGAIVNFATASREAAKKVQEWAQAHREATAALRAQAEAITSVTDKNEALAKSIEDIIALEKERAAIKVKPEVEQAARGRKPGETEEEFIRRHALQVAKAGVVPVKQSKEDEDRLKILDKEIERRKAIQALIIAKTNLAGPEREALSLAEAERRRNIEDERFQAELANATPGRRIELLAEHREQIARRETEAFGGLEARRRAAEERSGIEGQLAPLVTTQRTEEAAFQERTKQGLVTKDEQRAFRRGQRDRQNEIDRLEGERLKIGLQAPETSSVFQEARAEQLRQAKQADIAEARAKALEETGGKTPESAEFRRAARGARIRAGGATFSEEALQETQVKATIAKRVEAEAGGFGAQKEAIQAQVDAANRELAITISRAAAERQISDLKSEGADRARDEYVVRQRQIEDELNLLRQQKEPDRAAILQLESQRALNDRQEQLRQRSQREERSNIQLELGAHAARRAGHSVQAQALEDLSTFTKHFEELQDRFNPKEAARLALAQTRDEMLERLQPMPHVVAGSLARIGGGGGVYAAGGNEVVQLTRRQTILIAEANDWLRKIYMSDKGVL